jgi:ABC-type phosphate transport system substrate-binding protein
MSSFMTRRHFLASASALCAAVLWQREAHAGGNIVLVLNTTNGASPDLAGAKKIFLGDVAFWPGNGAVRIFVRPSDSPAGDAFFRAISVAPARFKRLWQEKQLSGQGTTPEIVVAASALVAKIAADPGGIGYALADEIPEGTTGVRIVPLR